MFLFFFSVLGFFGIVGFVFFGIFGFGVFGIFGLGFFGCVKGKRVVVFQGLNYSSSPKRQS